MCASERRSTATPIRRDDDLCQMVRSIHHMAAEEACGGGRVYKLRLVEDDCRLEVSARIGIGADCSFVRWMDGHVGIAGR